MSTNADNQRKRELSEKIAPEIKNLIKKYGYEAVAYTWGKTVTKQREINKAEQESKEAQAKVVALKRALSEL